MALLCDSRGSFLRRLDCPGCRSGRDEAACAVFGKCVPIPLTASGVAKFGAIQACSTCEKRTVNGELVGVPLATTQRETPKDNRIKGPTGQFSEAGLEPAENFNWCTTHLSDREFETNPSILLLDDRQYAAFQYKRDSIMFTVCVGFDRLDPGALILLPRLPESMAGVTHPRLFEGPAGTVWLSYSGIGRDGKETPFICWLAIPSTPGPWASIGVLSHSALNWSGFGDEEKHLVYFPLKDSMVAIYNWEPLVMFAVNGNGNCGYFGVNGWKEKTPYTILGGACPVRKDGKLYCFVQFATHKKQVGVGVLTLEGEAPFRVLGCSKMPIFTATGDRDCASVLPLGAAFNAGKWWVSLGRCNKGATIVAFEEATIEAAMEGK